MSEGGKEMYKVFDYGAYKPKVCLGPKVATLSMMSGGRRRNVKM